MAAAAAAAAAAGSSSAPRARRSYVCSARPVCQAECGGGDLSRLSLSLLARDMHAPKTLRTSIQGTWRSMVALGDAALC